MQLQFPHNFLCAVFVCTVQIYCGGAGCVGALAVGSQLNRNGSGYFRGWGAAFEHGAHQLARPGWYPASVLAVIAESCLAQQKPILCIPQAEISGRQPPPQVEDSCPRIPSGPNLPFTTRQI